MSKDEPEIKQLVRVMVYAEEYVKAIVANAEVRLAFFEPDEKEKQTLAVELFFEKARAYIQSLGNLAFVDIAGRDDLPTTRILPDATELEILQAALDEGLGRKQLMKTDFSMYIDM